MNKRHLLLYFPLDDPLFEDQDYIIRNYIKNHCDIIEIALPVKDPVLDGDTIRNSMSRILGRKTRDEFFEDIYKLKCAYPEIKIQLMTYSSAIKETGIDDFLKKANKAGVSYVLSPDADRQFNTKLKNSSEKGNLQIISFSSLSVDEDEMDYLKKSEGYIFQRSTDGQTGVPGSFSDKLGEKIDAIKTAGIKTPVVVGFGVSEPSHFKMIFDLNADGAVIGSALFKHILNKDLNEYLKQFKEWYE